MKLALCGNPNVGKTTLYNRLTRSDAPVGNWHGVTVDARTKRMNGDVLTDLPGAYSLTTRTPEEQITADSVLFGDYDVFIYVAEVNNLRRNLYMLMQLLEAGKRCVLVVNMMDEAKGKVDLKALEARLGLPVIGTSARAQNPKEQIREAAERAARMPVRVPEYTRDRRIRQITQKIERRAEAIGLTPQYAALKLIERDEQVMAKLAAPVIGEDRDLPARLRYKYIDDVIGGIIYKPRTSPRTVKLDKIFLGRAAIPVFLVIMAAVFVITFEAAKPLSDLISSGLVPLCKLVQAANLPHWVISLIADGVIAGVGSVLSFLPQVALLFLLTALLQDSGYMSRVAFATDGFFRRFGLSGRAAFSLVLGLGCSATAVMSTRGIAGDGARRRTAFVTPFCPCSARLAVFTAIAAYMGLSGIVVGAMYVTSFAVILGVLKIMRMFEKEREALPTITEMPPYRIPRAKRVLSVVLHNVWAFIARIGSVVLIVSIIFWALCNFSVVYGFEGSAENSLMCTAAKLIAPIFAPLGFGSWQAVAALVSGVAAKETVISVIASLGGMQTVFGTSKFAAVSFMIFTCLYVPCIATVSALAKETGLKTAAISIAAHTSIAYTASLVFYQSARVCSVYPIAFVATAISVVTVAIVAAVIIKIVRAKRKTRTA